MNGRIMGLGGVPLIGGAAGQPVSPMLDIKQEENGPTFRLPVVAVGFIQPELLEALAGAIAEKIVQRTLQVASEATSKEMP